MSEWLTTGEMIDRLKVGEVAVDEYGTKIQLDELKGLVFVSSGNTVANIPPFLKRKWRILPRYVSFEEAMKAMRKGKTITCTLPDSGEKAKFWFEDDTVKSVGFPLHWYCIFEGKWTIEE
jgi:hypothetical protein